MDKVRDAKKRCPHLVAVHVATYREGEKEPGYWENPDTLTHKVRNQELFLSKKSPIHYVSGLTGPLPTGKCEDHSTIQGVPSRC